ncbi:MAG: SDR family oxidoreductase [Candidatus Pacebacteria bacterium]|nr:SDR family oxidoreductase [Candidatus Paceibacterota bacterium]MBT4652161.1 SDR family oxidoreductase [Candidatus Paceibacterota bacterium]MBT6756699.1 SDR family oxidoreductase [Candidatus Paceibacterota bacterium]MBT6920969.1 SDR family oxidoreductase [Candidatus Paceibacterota bacterium]
MKKTALITGASSGIGKELSRIHASKGGDLVIVARRKDKLDKLKSELERKYKINVTVISKDLSDINSAKEIYDQVKSDNIKVDYLMNNAGFGGQGNFHERDWENDLDMMNVNMVTLTALTRFFLEDFVKRNEGKIMNTSSVAAFMPGPLQAVYFASKAYVLSLSNAIAQELSDTNITVTALIPGATKTEFSKVSGMDKTSLFRDSVSAQSVAREGYSGMINGDLDVIAGVTGIRKLQMKIISLIPKKFILKNIHKLQKVNEHEK